MFVCFACLIEFVKVLDLVAPVFGVQDFGVLGGDQWVLEKGETTLLEQNLITDLMTVEAAGSASGAAFLLHHHR